MLPAVISANYPNLSSIKYFTTLTVLSTPSSLLLIHKSYSLESPHLPLAWRLWYCFLCLSCLFIFATASCSFKCYLSIIRFILASLCPVTKIEIKFLCPSKTDSAQRPTITKDSPSSALSRIHSNCISAIISSIEFV